MDSINTVVMPVIILVTIFILMSDITLASPLRFQQLCIALILSGTTSVLIRFFSLLFSVCVVVNVDNYQLV